MKTLLSLVVALVFAATSARADIVFHIDTVLQEFWFSGNDRGDTHFTGAEHFVAYSNELSFASTFQTFDIHPAFSINIGTLTSAEWDQYQEPHGSFVFKIQNGGSPLNYNVTITADDSVRFSYAGLDQNRRDRLVEFANNHTPFYAKSYNPGMQTIQTVPEPSTYALLALGALATGFAWTRRRMAN